jgi:hypothetical protein
VPPPVSPARGPPTDWGELVQVHDDRAIFQASRIELPDIESTASDRRRTPGHDKAPRPPDSERPRVDGRKMTLQVGGQPFQVPLIGCRKTRHQPHQPLIGSEMPVDKVAEVPLAGPYFILESVTGLHQ